MSKRDRSAGTRDQQKHRDYPRDQPAAEIMAARSVLRRSEPRFGAFAIMVEPDTEPIPLSGYSITHIVVEESHRLLSGIAGQNLFECQSLAP